MKLLLVSDKEDAYIWDHFDKERFSDIDLILSCGDLKAEYLSYLVDMVNKPLFYVPGNHDKTYVDHPPEGCDSLDGKVICYQGLRMAGLGGSMRYNLGLFQYTEQEMHSRLNRLKPSIWMKGGLDIFVSHAPAFGMCDGHDLCHTGFHCFTDMIDKFKPRYFIHGHNHLDYGKFSRICSRSGTQIINAFGYYILDTDKPDKIKSIESQEEL
jgi:uncharacterized protein